MMVQGVRAWVRSKRWPVRGARPQGDSACREMNGVLLQPCEGHQTAKSTWTQASPLSAGACSPAAREVSQREQRGRRWNGARRGGQDGQLFSVKGPRSAIWTRTRANRWCRTCGAPGVGRVSVTVTCFASVSIDTTVATGLSL